ncbi:uncharacterized protein [Rutidosis leptorrhynchoides]|uniref:uncharacterized protein n=1 Tax=Rutidosis leptorrhynchoides TaxID=125765 RepID=UPI003A9A2A0B
MAETNKFHSVITVTNIKNTIPVTLDMDTSKYMSWVTLFKTHCRVYQVLDHIIPKSQTTESSSTTINTTPNSIVNKETCDRLDPIVLQWIYGTISIDMLDNILKLDKTAPDAVTASSQFLKTTKTLMMFIFGTKFSNIRLDSYPNVTAYCQALKTIDDELADVGPSLEEDHIILQLIIGLNNNYDHVGSQISNTKPLPSFYEARSTLIMEESCKQQQVANTPVTQTDTVLMVNYSQNSSSISNNRNPNSFNRGHGRGSYNGSSRGNNRGRNSNYRGRGNPRPYFGTTNGPPQWAFKPWTGQLTHWSPYPCPYLTTTMNRPNGTQGSYHGIFGPHPQSSYANSVASTPTDIDSAMYTMSLSPPDNNWYMDTRGLSKGDPHFAV